MKKEYGITLIALVITIIVLLILAGVSIALLMGENGILTKATIASEGTKKQGALEKTKIAAIGSYGNDGKIDKLNLKDNLNQVEGIEQITEDITSLPYDVVVDGYRITISENGKVDFIIGGNWTGYINSPKLISDMRPVYWDDSNNEVETNSLDTNWYDYNNQKWANVKTSDGSYFVWIPRYEYKIVSGEGTNTAGVIDIKFISTDKITPDDGYKIHPAFQNGTTNEFKYGEWDKELSGIWVGKYENSMEINGIPTDTSAKEVGNVYTNGSIKAVSKPGVMSWRNADIGICYINSYNYDRSKDSHLMKNSEWGAVAYLAYSKYGRNSEEITINEDESFFTGGGSEDAYKVNANQSTTGNVTGIYDMSGCTVERTSAYVKNGNNNLINIGLQITSEGISNKYITAYPYNNENDSLNGNYDFYKQSDEKKYGDAILETSSATGLNSWFGDFSNYPNSNWPFFSRGGRNGNETGAGLFAFSTTAGTATDLGGYRTCLIF